MEKISIKDLAKLVEGKLFVMTSAREAHYTNKVETVSTSLIRFEDNLTYAYYDWPEDVAVHGVHLPSEKVEAYRENNGRIWIYCTCPHKGFDTKYTLSEAKLC